MADIRYYLAVAALYGVTFFLQPFIVAMRVTMWREVTSNDLKSSFQWFLPYRMILIALGLVVSVLAPAIVGVHIIVPTLVFGFCLALTLGDTLQADRIARRKSLMQAKERASKTRSRP